MKVKYIILSFFILAISFGLSSCLDFVEDGIDIEHGVSNASLTVENIGSPNGASNETVSFSIQVRSEYDIKSCIIQTSIEGRNGSGFNVSDNDFDDPFADHIYGTIQPGIKSFKIRYDYIIPDETNKSRISFTIIDESGKVKEEKLIEVVSATKFHKDLTVYAKNSTFHDALAASNGKVYPDIKTNYSTLTEANLKVQKEIDIVFYYNPASKRASIVSPASGRLDLELSVENATQFRRMSLPSDADLSVITASELEKMTAELDLLDEGSSNIDGIKVGDVIGFIADLNASNSLKKGIIKIEGLHPGSVARYDGVSYVLECSIIIQI